MEKQESRRIQMTKLLIRSALIELMDEKNFERITIKELCERANVNRTTFYLHYSDQRSVLTDVKETVCKKTVAMIGEADFSDPTYFVEQFLTYIKENDRQFRILFFHDEGDTFRFSLMDAVAKELIQYLPTTADPQTDAFAFAYLMSGSLSIIIEWMKTNYERSARELAGFIFKINHSVKW